MSKHKKAKKSTPPQHRPQPKSLTPKLERQLDQVNALLREGNTGEAVRLLEELHQTNPRQPDILNELINLYANIEDKQNYLRYAQRLFQLLPGDEDVLLATAQGYMMNFYPALAIKSYQTVLRRFPNASAAEEIRTKITEIEQILHDSLEEQNLPKENWLEIATLQDTVRFNLEFGYFAEARNASNQLLKILPNFVPALNNLSQIEWLSGNGEVAIATAQRVLAIDPANYHANANLSRFYLFSGKKEQAKQYVDRMDANQSEDTDFWLKKLETLSYLGDDQAILATVEAALESAAGKYVTEHAIFWHYSAVAAMRRGDEEQARLWWERALEEEPNFGLAQKNLDDLDKPRHERNAPWVFDLQQWISRAEIDKFVAALRTTANVNRAPTPSEAKRLLAQFPGIVQRLPIILQRGDEQSRTFALRFAGLLPTPEVLAMIGEYAFSQDGPDASRIEAANIAQQHKALLPGTHRIWMRGEWTEILFFGFEITEEPSDTYKHSAEVIEWYADALDALNEGHPDKAEALLKKALEREPDKPDLLNNLAAVYAQQGRQDESTAIIEEIYAKHPDYFFGITNMASILIRRGNLEEATRILEPLMKLGEYHISEARAFCQAEIHLQLEKKQVEGARSWLTMWKSFDKESPQVKAWEKRIERGEQISTLDNPIERLKDWSPRRRRK